MVSEGRRGVHLWVEYFLPLGAHQKDVTMQSTGAPMTGAAPQRKVEFGSRHQQQIKNKGEGGGVLVWA